MPALQPPDTIHLQAATGWVGLGDHAAYDELELISAANRAHPDVLQLRWRIYAGARSQPARPESGLLAHGGAGGGPEAGQGNGRRFGPCSGTRAGKLCALSRVSALWPLFLLKHAPRFPYNGGNDASILPKLVKLADRRQALARNFWGTAAPAHGLYGATLRPLLQGGSTGAG
jgi:hypothetical protein